MAKTRQEVRDFLNSQVGLMVNAKAGIFNGQCVTLIKALLEFLGAPNPYAARGNAKDAGNTLVRQGIAANKKGWLNVVVNRDMGNIYEPSLGKYVNYGHIWLDLEGEANYEQNGARALHVTKNTRPISQAQQIINLDQYIKTDERKQDMVTASGVDRIFRFRLGRSADAGALKSYVGKHTDDELDKIVKASDEYKQLPKRYAAGEQFAVNHLPSIVRDKYVEGAAKLWDVDRIFRFRLGRKATDAENQKYVGKMTNSQVDEAVKATDEYKNLPKLLESGKFKAKDHLPSVVRDIYVEPTGEKPQSLKKGLYQVD